VSSPPYLAQSIAQDISSEQLALIESQNLELPGVDIETQAVRDYLFGDLFFHSIGYTGEINDSELSHLQIQFPERNYRLGDQKGVIGIERIFEPILRGQDGRDFIVVDVKGRRVNQEEWDLLPRASRIEPQAGQSLQLSLDLSLQEETVKNFGDKVGAAVALDPNTGQVLSYVSRPALDPNIFTRVISNADFQKMMNQENNPFLDRVAGEHYPPGSTFKLVMATAALETGAIDLKTTFTCPGYFRLGNRVWRCWDHGGHGTLNVVQAIERSCDVFFYNVAQALGLDTMFAWSSRLGLGRQTFIGNEIFSEKTTELLRFNSEQSGFIPNVAWVERRHLSSVEGETINAGIGQGAYLVTALQLARVVSALGNGGNIYQPQLVLNSLLDGKIHGFHSVLENQISIRPDVREALMKGMQNVVEGSFGTAHAAHVPGIVVGAKTGTAQVASLELTKGASTAMKKKLQDHGLFVALAPLDKPRIAIAIIVENGGHGGTVAAPIARAMIKNYLQRDQVKIELDQKTAGATLKNADATDE